MTMNHQKLTFIYTYNYTLLLLDSFEIQNQTIPIYFQVVFLVYLYTTFHKSESSYRS